MGINYQRIINSRFGVGFTLAFARLLPPSMAYPFANYLASRLSTRSQLTLVQAARINQWVITGENMTAGQLDEQVADTLRHTAHCLYDTYHYMRDEEAKRRLIKLSDGAREKLEEIKQSKTGLIIVSPHMSNFDFVGQAVAGSEIEGLALAFPQPTGGYRWQNEIRRRSGLDIVPTSLESMRRATKVLQSGGIVLTAVDRPLAESNHPVSFFGRLAPMPLHHIMLALKAGVSIGVVSVVMDSDGCYEVVYSEPVIMDRYKARNQELVSNAEKVLREVEKFIRLAPHQWSMYYPVWPEVQDSLPYN